VIRDTENFLEKQFQKMCLQHIQSILDTCSYALNMRAARFSETVVRIYRNTWHHITDNFKSS